MRGSERSYNVLLDGNNPHGITNLRDFKGKVRKQGLNLSASLQYYSQASSKRKCGSMVIIVACGRRATMLGLFGSSCVVVVLGIAVWVSDPPHPAQQRHRIGQESV